MIRNIKLWEKFEEEMLLRDNMTYKERLKLLEDFLRFSKEIKKFSQDDFMEDIKNHEKIERILNGIKS